MKAAPFGRTLSCYLTPILAENEMTSRMGAVKLVISATSKPFPIEVIKMRVLFQSDSPFSFAHGGAQIQIEQTMAGLRAIGVEVDYMRWWDEAQTGDIVHYFNVPSVSIQKLARQKKFPLVSTVLLTETCNRSTARLFAQGVATRSLLALPFGNSVKNQLAWKSYLQSDCMIVGLHAEKRVLQMVYGVGEERIKLLPIGCEREFLNAAPSTRTGNFLISFGTITARKRPVELAQIAIAAGVPILFVGKPYSEEDPYWLRFQQLAKDNPLIQHRTHVGDRNELVSLLQQARGFVLYSKYENWCIAADEASACGLPLLVPDQNWSQERFGNSVRYFSGDNPARNSAILRAFFEDCPRLAPPLRPKSWEDVARELRGIYESVIQRFSSNSR